MSWLCFRRSSASCSLLLCISAESSARASFSAIVARARLQLLARRSKILKQTHTWVQRLVEIKAVELLLIRSRLHLTVGNNE